MPRSPSQAARCARDVDALLRDLGPRLRRGAAPTLPSARLSTGIPPVDGLLDGGLPGGRLSEIAGPASSGRTSLGLSLLARSTGRGELAAVVDLADALDPASAEAAGVDLERVLWARPPAEREALRCAERLLEARGFALVLLDLVTPNPRIAPAAWPRLGRAAAGAGTALVVLSTRRVAGSAAEIALELRPRRALFAGTLLEGLETEIALVRSRTRAPHTASVHLRTDA